MENQTTTTKIALKWGAILGIVFIIFNTTMLVLGIQDSVNWLLYLLLGIGIYLSMNNYKTENQGYLSFGEGLGTGTMVSAISGLLVSAFSYVYMTFIDPTVTEQLLKRAELEMERKGYSDEQIEQALEYSKMFMSPSVLFVISIISVIFIGFILSLAIAAFVKKDKTIFE